MNLLSLSRQEFFAQFRLGTLDYGKIKHDLVLYTYSSKQLMTYLIRIKDLRLPRMITNELIYFLLWNGDFSASHQKEYVKIRANEKEDYRKFLKLLEKLGLPMYLKDMIDYAKTMLRLEVGEI